jgi:hypothetical protein
MTSLRLPAAAAIALASIGANAQTKNIVFSTPTTQNVLTINLVDNQPVTIGADGNMAARCTPNQAGTQCANIPTGGGGTPATASLSGNPPTGQTDITPGTVLQLTPQSDGAVCLRRSVPATTWGSAVFGNPLLAPFGNAISVTLSQGNQPYTLEMQCYGSGGVSTTVSWTGTTASGGGGPGPANCSTIAPPPGFSRTSASSFEQLATVNGPPLNPFPNSGGGFGVLGQSTTQYTSLAFTVPTNITDCVSGLPGGGCRVGQFDKSEITFVSPLNDDNYYFTISECPGDFRIPPDSTPAPVSDPTFSTGCRNWRAGSNSAAPRVDWNIFTTQPYAPSTDSRCHLESGKTYYFNFILDGPPGGINTNGAQQAGCLGGETFCGTGIRYRMF